MLRPSPIIQPNVLSSPRATIILHSVTIVSTDSFPRPLYLTCPRLRPVLDCWASWSYLPAFFYSFLFPQEPSGAEEKAVVAVAMVVAAAVAAKVTMIVAAAVAAKVMMIVVAAVAAAMVAAKVMTIVVKVVATVGKEEVRTMVVVVVLIGVATDPATTEVAVAGILAAWIGRTRFIFLAFPSKPADLIQSTPSSPRLGITSLSPLPPSLLSDSLSPLPVTSSPFLFYHTYLASLFLLITL